MGAKFFFSGPKFPPRFLVAPYRAILRYPISRDTFSGTQNGAIPPHLVLNFTQTHLCDTPFYNSSRDRCATPHKTSTKRVCDTIATSIARYEKYRCWASKKNITYIQTSEEFKLIFSSLHNFPPCPAHQLFPFSFVKENHPKMPNWDPQSEFPGIPWIGLFLGIPFFSNRNP